MTEGDNNGATPPSGPPIWLSATLNDFAGTDFEAPIRNCNSADCYDLHTLFSKAAEEAKTAGQHAAERAFTMLAAVCSFHFKPEEPNEPFGPMFSSADRRSAIVDDFRGKASEILESVVPKISSLVLAARIADTCWLIERSRAACASIAINNYVGIVNSVESGKLKYRFSSDGGVLDLHSVQYLRRALQIGYAIGSDKPETKSAQDTLGRLRQRAVAERLAFAIQLLASLDLDFQISTAEEVAKEIERIIPKPSDPSSFFLIHALWRLAARAYHQAKLGDEEARCIISAAECLAQQAEANKTSAMLEAHWLEMAIAEYRAVRGHKERKKELKHKLIDAQAGIGDEMGRISAETDITEVVKNTKAIIKGKSLILKLAIFAVLETPPDTSALRNGAIEQIRKFPLSSLFSTSHHDREGKVIHRSPGGGSLASEEEAAIEVQIVHLEEIRRGMAVSSRIEIVRQEIMAEHFATEFDLGVICSSSPFVPQGHEVTFSRGFVRFFQGDMIGALYVLTPQLENSLRHVLKQYGHDVVKINSADMTQQDRTISSLFENMREELNQIFGQATVDDIDRVFLRKPGPYIRHQAAHGLLLDGEPFGRDAIYACWLIFRLCCLPLLPHWKTIETRHNELYGRT